MAVIAFPQSASFIADYREMLRLASQEEIQGLRRLIKQELAVRRLRQKPKPAYLAGQVRFAALPSRIRALVAEICAAHGVSPHDVCGEARLPNVVRVRRILWAMLRVEKHSLARIGGWFGRDHTTVRYGLIQIKREAA